MDNVGTDTRRPWRGLFDEVGVLVDRASDRAVTAPPVLKDMFDALIDECGMTVLRGPRISMPFEID